MTGEDLYLKYWDEMSCYPDPLPQWSALQEREREAWRRIANRMNARIVPLRDVIKERLELALEAFSGDKKRAAAALGISIKTIYNYCHRYGWVRYEKPPTHLLATDTDQPR